MRWPTGTILLAAVMAATSAQAGEPTRVIAVGDLHGDYGAYQDIVRAAGLVDGKGHWIAGDTLFVQMGDVTDRGPDSRKIIDALRALDAEAEKAGGDVVVLVGNHEAMNVAGDLRYVHPGEVEAFAGPKSKKLRDAFYAANESSILAQARQSRPEASDEEIHEAFLAAYPPGKLEHRAAWQPGGAYGDWAASLPAVVKIGDTLFVHGGLSVETSARTIDTINAEVRAAAAAGQGAILTDELGPLWYRGNVMRDPVPEGTVDTRPSMADELTAVLATYAASRLVVAHTPSKKGIAASPDGRLLRIDTGISAHYGGPRTYLRIEPDRTVAVEKHGDAWVERALPVPETRP